MEYKFVYTFKPLLCLLFYFYFFVYIKSQPIASSIPYMTGIGCHERDDRYAIETDVSYGQYLNKFSGLLSLMGSSLSPSLHYYSWNIGLIHFISIDTDPWIYNNLYLNMYDRLYKQYNWLINDLQTINRNKTPWVIVYGHRSIYCQKKSNDNECRLESYFLADGIIDPVTQKPNSFPLEPFKKIILIHLRQFMY